MRAAHARRIGLRPKCPMSAYSASAPVTARMTTAPIANPSPGFEMRYAMPRVGESAMSTDGSPRMWKMPSPASTMNHSTMIGPKTRPIRCVPRDCTANRIARMTTVSGTARCPRSSLTTLRPSVAESTEIAGVSAPSPKRSAVPMRMRRSSAIRRPPVASRTFSGRRARRARIPPSPWLSARMTNSRYFVVTTSMRAQKMRETTPSTASRPLPETASVALSA